MLRCVKNAPLLNFVWNSQANEKKAVASELSILSLTISLAIAFFIVLASSVALSVIYYSLPI